MVSLEKVLAWAQLADPDARADAAFQLKKVAATADPLSQVEAIRTLGKLLCDDSLDVARVAFESLASPSALAAGLASPHPDIRDGCRDKLRGQSLAWEQLEDLGLDPSQAAELVTPTALIAAIREARSWSQLAIQEIAKRDLHQLWPPEIRQLRRALAGAGGDTSGVMKVLDDKRRAARANRSVPRATKLAHLSDFLAEFNADDDADDEADADHWERAHDLSFELSPGDLAALPAEVERMRPELQEDVIDVIGSGPPRGLFFLLAHLAGPHEEAAARAIAELCETFADEVVLTAAEYAIVKQWAPDVEEPLVDDNT
jgi:hypothetical protein